MEINVQEPLSPPRKCLLSEARSERVYQCSWIVAASEERSKQSQISSVTSIGEIASGILTLILDIKTF